MEPPVLGSKWIGGASGLSIVVFNRFKRSLDKCFGTHDATLRKTGNPGTK